MALLFEDVSAVSPVPGARSSVRKLFATWNATPAVVHFLHPHAEVEAGSHEAGPSVRAAWVGSEGVRYKAGTDDGDLLKHTILGLHHVTATVDEAQADLDFYRGTLGLRLVKKTVNFDNHNVYHFYYGNELGTPGTIWTTFPYKGWGVPRGRHGQGQITVTSFSVPAGSLQFWKNRLLDQGIAAHDVPPDDETEAVSFVDPSGLVIRLLAEAGDPRSPWTGSGVGTDAAVRGLHSVTLTLGDTARTMAFMTSVLGFTVIEEAERGVRLAVNGDVPGRRIELVRASHAPLARNGLGTVHHVAMAIETAEEQVQLRQDLVALGYAVTEILDRQYFQSIYFREPGGVLFEVATIQPGFLVDEAMDRLGQELKLPPWEEPNRSIIQKSLPPVA